MHRRIGRVDARIKHYSCFFCGLLNPWATMIRMSWARAASVEETLALWAASLREIKKRIRPLFTQERVAGNAGLFLEGLLGDEQRKTGWMRAEAAGDPGPWRQQAILGRRIGTRMPCAISCAIMSSSIWRMTMRCW